MGVWGGVGLGSDWSCGRDGGLSGDMMMGSEKWLVDYFQRCSLGDWVRV